MSIATYAKILTILGLGMNSIANISVPSTMGGSFYQNTVAQDRPFSIVANVTSGVASGDISGTMIKRKALMNALSPNLTKYKQPLILECTELDSASSPVSETLEIKCVYEGGLEGDYKPGFAFNDPVAMNFRTYVPYLTQQGEHGTTLGFQTTLTHADGILMRTTSGVWQAMSGGLDVAGGASAITASSYDGIVYVGGGFTNVGDLNGDYITSWNGSAWVSLGTGMDSNVLEIRIGPDGAVYAGGAFTLAGGVANTVRVAKWNGAVWAPLATGIGSGTDAIYTIALDNSSNLYAGGSFLNHVDANGDYISKWNGAAWASMGTGMNALVRALVVDKNNNVYAGGDFTLAGGVTGTAYIAKWNGTAWVALSTGMDDVVRALAIGEDGTLYAGGDFHTAGGVTVAHIAKWNGTAWSTLGAGVSDIVYGLTVDKNNILYAGGQFATAGGVTLSDSIALWNGTSWVPVDINMPGSAVVTNIEFDKAGNMYVGFSTTGSAISATVTAPNAGTTSYPKIKFTGPGSTYQLKNYTTGKAIYFNLTLLAGETAVLDLDPKKVSFVSSFRGNIMNAILPGSDLSWELLPGVNNVSAFMYGSTTAATTIYMYYRDQYESIDQAVR